MRDIEEIKKAMVTAGPGTVIDVMGYTDSKGVKSNLRLELIGAEGYRELQQSSLNILADLDEADLVPGDADEFNLSDFVTARQELVTSYLSSLRRFEDHGAPEQRGADYIALGGSVAGLEGNDDTIYIQRMKFTGGEPTRPKPAKGNIPRAKQELKHLFKLPSTLYVHNIKLVKGKFEEFTIIKKVEVPT